MRGRRGGITSRVDPPNGDGSSAADADTDRYEIIWYHARIKINID
jgi:hypothetical protein